MIMSRAPTMALLTAPGCADSQRKSWERVGSLFQGPVNGWREVHAGIPAPAILKFALTSG